jgi:cation diffusion facilitator family transporter
MKESIEIDDSFGENDEELKEKDNQDEEKKDSGLDILAIKTLDTLPYIGDEERKKFQEQLTEQTRKVLKRLTRITIYLAIFTGIEFIGSIISDSVGVLTIAAELFTDLIKSVIAIISILIIQNPANEVMTYGYHRSEIIASLCSILIVLVLSIWIVEDTIEIIKMPKQINGKWMFIFSVLGLFFNLIIRYIKDLNPVPDVDDGKFLKNYSKDKQLNTPLLEDYLEIEDKDKDKIVMKNMTQKQLIKMQTKEQIHLICDVSQSSLTIIASLLIYFYDVRFPLIRLLDDVCGFTFLIIMLILAWPIAKDCVDILMEAAPREIDIKTLYSELKEVPGVINMHDIHLWSLSIGRPCISFHILSNSPQKSLEGATKICKKYGITHSTIQVENNNEARRLSFIKCDLSEGNDIH